MPDNDYYKTLGVGKTSSDEDIRKAYKKRSTTGRPLKKLVKRVIWIIILLFALGAVNKFVFKNKMPVIGPLLNKLPVVGAMSGG